MDMLPVEPVDLSAGERIALGSDELCVLATSAQTGGALFAVTVRMPPGGGPPLLHRHAPGEVYHVLSGEFAFYIGRPDGTVHRLTAAAGQVVPLEGNTPHTVRNESDADALAFVVHAPGAPMEQFSRAAAALAATSEPTMDAMLVLAERHGIEMLGPVPTAV